MTTFSYDRLHQFALNLFIKIGCSRNQAIEAANVLLSADLRGVDSHGVARLLGYLQLYEKKRIFLIQRYFMNSGTKEKFYFS